MNQTTRITGSLSNADRFFSFVDPPSRPMAVCSHKSASHSREGKLHYSGTGEGRPSGNAGRSNSGGARGRQDGHICQYQCIRRVVAYARGARTDAVHLCYRLSYERANGQMKYAIDKARIAHQTVDGEVIAIDFVNGAYYSMRDTAAEIWLLLVAAVPLDEAIACYKEDNPEVAPAIDAEIRRFVLELETANLIAPSETAPAVDGAPQAAPAPRSPYSPPVLEIFEDMAELIMLDPVHDVTGLGWPYAASPNHGGGSKTE
jgi:hypothetical protein